jgi:hypothetical protein
MPIPLLKMFRKVKQILWGDFLLQQLCLLPPQLAMSGEKDARQHRSTL